MMKSIIIARVRLRERRRQRRVEEEANRAAVKLNYPPGWVIEYHLSGSLDKRWWQFWK